MESPKNLFCSSEFEIDMRIGPKPRHECYREKYCSPVPMKTASILDGSFSGSLLDALSREEEFNFDTRMIEPPAPVKTGSILEEDPFSSLADALRREKALCREEVKAVAPVVASRRETMGQRIQKYKPDPKEYAEFHRQFVMTDGFDLDFVCLWYADAPAIFKNMDEVDKLDHELDGSVRQEATHCAKFAINSYNEQHEESKLDFVELVKLNVRWGDGSLFYLTLKAKNGDGLVSVYQAKVWHGGDDEETQVMIFREKPSTYPEIKVEEIPGCGKKVLGRSKKKSGRGKKKHGCGKGCGCSGCNS